MDERLKELEQEVAALRAELRGSRRRYAVVGLALVAVAGLMGARGAPSVVRAERFELTDPDGEIRGVWETTGSSPTLAMDDGQGGIAVLRVEEGTARLELDGELQREITTEPEPEAVPVEVAPASPEAVVHIDGNRPYVGLTVTCFNTGLRYRVPFVAGLAALPDLPADDDCTAYLRGAGPPWRFKVKPGEQIKCLWTEHDKPHCLAVEE